MTNVSSRRTPINDEYPTCVEARAELLIYPGEIRPDDVTQRLGLTPTETNVAGNEVVNRLGRRRVVKKNGWFLSSEAAVKSLDVRRHLDWLLAQLGSRRDALLSFQETPGVRMSVNCAWYSRSGHGGPTLWPEQMRALAVLNLECSFDVYFLSDEDS